MLEALTYGVTLALFGYVLFATAWVRHDLLILACIPPVFFAAIVGFVMWIYTFETFGAVASVLSVLLPLPAAWVLQRRYAERDLVITIYLAWTVGMVCALVAFSFPDVAEKVMP